VIQRLIVLIGVETLCRFTPFNQLSDAELCPGAGALRKINATLR
jgi:hypothetical protein